MWNPDIQVVKFRNAYTQYEKLGLININDIEVWTIAVIFKLKIGKYLTLNDRIYKDTTTPRNANGRTEYLHLIGNLFAMCSFVGVGGDDRENLGLQI